MKHFIIFLFCLFSFNGVVKAEENVVLGGKMSGEYYTKEIAGIKFSDNIRMKYLKSDYRILYGIDPKQNYTSFNMIITDDYQDIGMSKEMFERLNLIAYYGYQYQNHVYDFWYVVTQFMIYNENSMGVDTYFTNSLNGPKLIKYEKWINEINDLIDNHYLKPIINDNYQLKYNEEKEYVDTNNVLSNYKIKKSKLVDATINDNKLKVKGLKTGNGYVILVKEDQRFKNKPLIYYHPNSQDLLLPGSYDPIEIKINFKITSGTLQLILIDELNQQNKNLNPSVFDINGNVYETNNNVIGPIDLLNGKYVINQLQSATGYQIDENISEFTVNGENEDKVMYIKNEMIRTDLKIIQEKNSMRLKNIHFQIYKDDTLINVIATNNNGEAEINLPYGNYSIKRLENSNLDDLDIFSYSVNENTNDQEEILLNEQSNPQTKDNILNYFVLLLTSIVLITFFKLIFYYKSHTN